ncbi:phosphodiesterase [Microbacterium timonense]|uniref:phosphodiesterase n=1 Tax=Microbacterium timonense TaxID=2086576 RepID=UPI000D0FB206|nr:phosphodiesterase [Microbacterium timonense]
MVPTPPPAAGGVAPQGPGQVGHDHVRAEHAGSTASVRFGQYPPARRTLLHISDTHLLAHNAPLAGRFDTAANLARTLEAAEATGIRPDAIVFTGDLTDLGEPEAYTALRAAAEPVAERLGAPVVWVAGNHDERPALRRDLLGLEPTEHPVTGVWDLGGLRLIALDSSVPGWHHGDLDGAQLEWLASELSTPAPLGTILALHHPPLPSHVPLFDILELRDQHRLAAVIAGTDVRAILAGHLHYSTSGTFAGVPVSVAAATCYTMNLARAAVDVNGMDAGQSFHLVHVYDDTITHAVVPVVDAPTGDFFSAEWVERMSRLTPEQRLEEFSRKRR